MTETTDTYRDRYVAALAAHTSRRDEATLRVAYELGREAVSDELTVLDLAVTHHGALNAALGDSPQAAQREIVEAACDFFVEALAAYEMVQRGVREAHEATLVEQHHAAILRQLSNFLADASVALDAASSLEEMLQLVVEQARELLGARRCSARLVFRDEPLDPIEAYSEAESGAPATAGGRIEAAFVGWDGRELGTIEACDKTNGEFTDVDAAVLVHLAQMASAALERARVYRRDA